MAILLSEATYARIMAAVEYVESLPRGVGAGLDRTQQGSLVTPSVQLYLGKLSADSTKGSTGSMKLWAGTAGSETVSSSSYSVGFYNKFGNVTSGKWGAVASFNNALYLLSAECG